MTMVINGSGSITGLSAGGLPSATVTQATLATPVYSQGVPAFSAYRSGSQSGFSSGVFGKIQFNAEEYDTSNCFDSTTNYRFTPTVAGYYQLNAGVSPSAFTGNYFLVGLYKNGSLYKNGTNYSPNTLAGATGTVSSLVYLNGSTDYVEIYIVVNGTPFVNGTNTADTYFNGSLVRGS
jgi:hypothetical protein